jgi:hypothetical protein
MLSKEIIAVYYENHTKHTNNLCWAEIKSFSTLKQVISIVTIVIKRLNYC